jgi:hypothetical protein
MEAARALQKLINEGILEKPKRTIKFTLVPEMSGSYTHLNANEEEITNMIAAINLDMVGEKQSQTASTFIIERTPESTPSFVNGLIESIFTEIKGEVKNLGGSGKYASFRHTITPFSGGSDHYIYSDPTVDVPCPMIIQWPDKYWHTSYDTIDKVDPDMLRKAALITATYAYTIANAGEDTALWLASETYSNEKKYIMERLQRKFTEIVNNQEFTTENIGFLEKQVNYWIERAGKAIISVKILVPDNRELDETINLLLEDLEKSIRNQLEIEKKILLNFIKSPGGQTESSKEKSTEEMKEEANHMIPERVYRGPVSSRNWVNKMSREDRESFRKFSKKFEDERTLGTLGLYWTDGNRSIEEINELVELETGRSNLEYVLQYFRFLEKMRLIKITNR